MTLAEKYINQLREQEPELCPEPFPKSLLTEADLQEIEQGLGYPLPKQYREFLQSYQLPDLTVYIAFCRDDFFFWQTFSRKDNGYVPIPSDGDEAPALVDMHWYGQTGSCGKDYLDCFKRQAGEMAAWLEAGFIQLADFYMEDYFVFYDLVSGEVLSIHNEDIMESSFVFENWNNPAGIRAFMEEETRLLCQDFNGFLRLVCIGELYGADHIS